VVKNGSNPFYAPAAGHHGIAGIQRQVQNYEFEFAGVNLNRP